MTTNDATRTSSSDGSCVDGLCEIRQEPPGDADLLGTGSSSSGDSPSSAPALRPWPDAELGTPGSDEE
jgi:hypothetical protein